MTAMPNWQAFIRMSMYPIQFDAEPHEHVEKVLRLVIDRDKENLPADYLRALDAALHSAESLKDLLPQDHPEAVIRRFLAEVEKALRLRLGAETTS